MTNHLPGTIEIPRSVASRDSLDLSTIRPCRVCPQCRGSGDGPEYGPAGEECEACAGTGTTVAPCVSCDADADVLVGADALCSHCADRPWIGPRLTGSTEDQAAELLRLADAALMARKVTLPALRLAGEMLAKGVRGGMRKRVVETTGEAA